jgi:PAS domain S-box-containing protein
MLRAETILKSISDALFTLDREWRFTYLNPQAEGLLQKSAGDLLGKLVWDEFPVEAGSGFDTNFRRAFETQTTLSFEEYYESLKTWFEVTVYPYPEGLSVYFRDISSRKEVEAAFQEQIRLAKLITEISQALTHKATLPEMLHSCTEALVNILGVSFARIWTFNRATNMLVLQASSGKYTHLDGPHSQIPLGSFKIGWIAEHRQPHLTNSVRGDSMIADQEWAARENMVAFAGYPLVLDDRLLGVVAMFSHKPISENTYRAIETLVNQFTVGIERKLGETTLRDQREYYEVTLASIGDGVIATDHQGRVTFLNAVAEDLTGWKSDEAMQKPLTTIFKIVNMTTGLPVENPVSLVLEQGQVVGLANHTVLVARDGREIPIEDSAAPIRNQARQIIGVVLVFRDATERLDQEEARQQGLVRERQARQEAEESRNRLFNLFMQAPAAIAVLEGPEHIFTLANEPYLRLTGHDTSILNKPIAEVAGQGYLELLDQVYRTGKPYTGHEARALLPREGKEELEEVFLDFIYQPYTNGEGKVEGIFYHGVDVTEQVQNRRRNEGLVAQLAEQQAQLRANNEKLQFLAEASATLASSLDYNVTLKKVADLLTPSMADFCYFDIIADNGKVERVAWQNRTGLPEELIQQIGQYTPQLDQAGHPMMEMVNSGQPKLVEYVTDEWLRQATLDEEHYGLVRQVGIISYLGVPLKLRDTIFGTISMCYTTVSGRHYTEADPALILEMTRRAAMAIDNSRLYYTTQRALKERETFLSVAAHELKTPLTGLKGFTQVLNRQLARDEQQALDPARIKRTLDIINKQSDKLTYLIDQLLDVSRIETGKLQLDLRQTELVELVRELVEQAQNRTNRHTLTFRAAEESLLTRIDPVRYEQVVNNLLDNAIKYSPQGGPIEVELRRVEATGEGEDAGGSPAFGVSVTDQGLGIPEDRRGHIFERFYQAHETSLIGGMGLGLFICQQIIQLHGGDIHAEFPEEGGSRFVVTVPLNE